VSKRKGVRGIEREEGRERGGDRKEGRERKGERGREREEGERGRRDGGGRERLEIRYS